jgi:hypothetical protein
MNNKRKMEKKKINRPRPRQGRGTVQTIQERRTGTFLPPSVTRTL